VNVNIYRVIHLPLQRFIRIKGSMSLYLVNAKKLPTTESVIGILAKDKPQSGRGE